MTANTNTKPNTCEVLGVEVGEILRVVDPTAGYNTIKFYFDDDGRPRRKCDDEPFNGLAVIHAINHPETLVRVPRFTDDELTLFRLIGAQWASRDSEKSDSSDKVYFTNCKPSQLSPFGTWYAPYYDGYLPASLFLSIKPGQLVNVAEVLEQTAVRIGE